MTINQEAMQLLEQIDEERALSGHPLASKVKSLLRRSNEYDVNGYQVDPDEKCCHECDSTQVVE